MKTISQLRDEKANSSSTPIASCTRLLVDLKSMRIEHRITAEQVAKEVGVHRNTIDLIERGKEVQLATALKLAKFYETTVDEIWGLPEVA